MNHEDGDQATTVQPGLQNGAAAASAEAQGDVGQLIDLAEDHNVDEENGYRVELRQQTEQSTSTAECLQQLDGTEQVSMRTRKKEIHLFMPGIFQTHYRKLLLIVTLLL